MSKLLENAQNVEEETAHTYLDHFMSGAVTKTPHKQPPLFPLTVHSTAHINNNINNDNSIIDNNNDNTPIFFGQYPPCHEFTNRKTQERDENFRFIVKTESMEELLKEGQRRKYHTAGSGHNFFSSNSTIQENGSICFPLIGDRTNKVVILTPTTETSPQVSSQTSRTPSPPSPLTLPTSTSTSTPTPTTTTSSPPVSKTIPSSMTITTTNNSPKYLHISPPDPSTPQLRKMENKVQEEILKVQDFSSNSFQHETSPCTKSTSFGWKYSQYLFQEKNDRGVSTPCGCSKKNRKGTAKLASRLVSNVNVQAILKLDPKVLMETEQKHRNSRKKFNRQWSTLVPAKIPPGKHKSFGSSTCGDSVPSPPPSSHNLLMRNKDALRSGTSSNLTPLLFN